MPRRTAIARDRRLRSRMTDAELPLWRRIRCRQVLGLKFRRQHPFGPYIVDFVCLERKLIIEIDGGQHMEQAAADNARSACLQSKGFTVLRFWNNEVLQEIEAVLGHIRRSLS